MDTSLVFVGAGLAIGLAGLGVSIGEAIVAATSIEASGKNPELDGVIKRTTIIGIALVESAAIYGLIIGILIVFSGSLTVGQALGAGIAVGLPGLVVGLGEGLIVQNTIKAILRNPSAGDKIRANMFVYVALVESAAIYGLILAILILYR